MVEAFTDGSWDFAGKMVEHYNGMIDTIADGMDELGDDFKEYKLSFRCVFFSSFVYSAHNYHAV